MIPAENTNMAKQHPRSSQGQPAPGSSASTASEAKPQVLPRAETGDGALGTRLATVAAVGVAAALIEVDWIPGLLLGVAAMAAPNLLPRLGQGLRPFVKGAVRAGYSVVEKTRETVAEASEQFQDIVAEVRAEQGSPQAATAHGAEPSA